MSPRSETALFLTLEPPGKNVVESNTTKAFKSGLKSNRHSV